MMLNQPYPNPLRERGRSEDLKASLHFKIMYEILVKVVTLNQQRTSTLTYSNTSTL